MPGYDGPQSVFSQHSRRWGATRRNPAPWLAFAARVGPGASRMQQACRAARVGEAPQAGREGTRSASCTRDTILDFLCQRGTEPSLYFLDGAPALRHPIGMCKSFAIGVLVLVAAGCAPLCTPFYDAPWCSRATAPAGITSYGGNGPAQTFTDTTRGIAVTESRSTLGWSGTLPAPAGTWCLKPPPPWQPYFTIAEYERCKEVR